MNSDLTARARALLDEPGTQDYFTRCAGYLLPDLASALEAVVAERDEWERRANREYDRRRAAAAERDALRDAIRKHRNAYQFRHIAVTAPMDAYHLQLWAHVDQDAAEALSAMSVDPDQQGT